MNEFTGKDLLELGYEPGPWFKKVLEDVEKKRMSKSQAIRHAQKAHQEFLDKQPKTIPLSEGVPFHVNMIPENDFEQANMNAVVKSFEHLVKVPTVVAATIMPDACPAGEVGEITVGGVIGAKNAIHPGMHSADICCSMFVSVIEGAEPKQVLDAMQSVTHFGKGGRNDGRFELPTDLLEKFKSNDYLSNGKILHQARTHLGTQGDGNHFAYVGTNRKGKTVLVTHHGSRGVGGLLYKLGMKDAVELQQKICPEVSKKNAWLWADSKQGEEYWKALQIVREWTKLNHQVLHDESISVLGARLDDRLWNEHNFVFQEDDVFWHAKGATPIHNAFLPDTSGVQIVPMNMAQPILLVQGKRNGNNLGFAPHGAGRNMSRTQHKKLHEGKTDKEIFDEETKGLDARFFANKIDISELPSAYKNADSVQRDMRHFNLAKVVEKIEPFGCIMAGDQPMEPWLVAKMEKKRAQNREAKLSIKEGLEEYEAERRDEDDFRM